MTAATIEDYYWLTSDAAATWLSLAAELVHDPIVSARRLRRELSEVRAALVQEQAQLRLRAARKFSLASRLFFTARGLEQATDGTIARYKQERFATNDRVADLCCGIGGDTMAIAARGPVVGIDKDEVVALFAAANLAARVGYDVGPATVRCGDAAECELTEFASWHIDPDRRPRGNRTTQVSLHEPDDASIDTFRVSNANAAIKLAPGGEVPAHWAAEAELEWIGHERECKQLVAWFGSLAIAPGERRATVLQGDIAHSFVGTRMQGTSVAANLGRFLYEPHAAVLAADLWRDLAKKRGLQAVDANIPYLTADAALDDPLLGQFEVLEVLPFDRKRVKAALRARSAGRLEIKKRGVQIVPEQLRKELAVDGDEAYTLIVTRRAKKTIAVLAKRCSQ